MWYHKVNPRLGEHFEIYGKPRHLSFIAMFTNGIVAQPLLGDITCIDLVHKGGTQKDFQVSIATLGL